MSCYFPSVPLAHSYAAAAAAVGAGGTNGEFEFDDDDELDAAMADAAANIETMMSQRSDNDDGAPPPSDSKPAAIAGHDHKPAGAASAKNDDEAKRSGWNAMTVPKLTEECKKKGINKVSKLKKEQLIEKLKEHFKKNGDGIESKMSVVAAPSGKSLHHAVHVHRF